MITNTFTILNTDGTVAYVGQAVASSNNDQLFAIFMAALALGTALSATVLVYRKVKEGLNATSSD